ncbi:type II secretion system F family protein [Streptomyces sp. NRRL F-5126]|uniref:type II secretion system F family protein n=1 Tax=Streptomyces sp. NRRL F-5126 TaxID=1463857 RepID=UPI000A514BCB|nr:type II secretion system F family protein [Streptomyces sp. NRRL F-5126]
MSGAFFHRLWVTVSVVTASGCLAMALSGRLGERAVRRRTAALFGVARSRGPVFARVALPGRARRVAPLLGAFLAGWLLVGGVAGALVGVAAAVGLRRWLRTRKTGEQGRAAADEAVRRLPLAADLLAACTAAGAGPREAAEAVGSSLGGPVGDRLAGAAAEIGLGGEPAAAWGRFGEIPGAAGLARCLERACASGAPAAEPLARLADGLRAERSRRATARAQRAQVLITGPVGLCFLPAFLATGVAPVVIGLAKGLLSGG